jgi:hypothetical protein
MASTEECVVDIDVVIWVDGFEIVEEEEDEEAMGDE